jgi:hypothetical protein
MMIADKHRSIGAVSSLSVQGAGVAAAADALAAVGAENRTRSKYRAVSATAGESVRVNQFQPEQADQQR